MGNLDFKALAQGMRDELIARRRDFHRHPETAFEEMRTAGIVAQELAALGLEVQTGVGKTGVVAILEGERDGPTVLVRADMDALPVQEENRVEYASSHAGKMHACGHDGHTAIALGVAKLFAERRAEVAGRIKFVFQPAEEIAEGAVAMIKDGALGSPRPDVTLGLHLWNSLPVGTVGVTEGPAMAGSSIFSVRITGKGGHAASPHFGIDPVVCAAQLITAFQTIISRNLDPFETGVISTTFIRAGETHNVIPQTAELVGTVRAFRTETRDLMFKRMAEMVEHLCAGMGCEGALTYRHQTLPVNNRPEVMRQIRSRFAEIVGENGLDANVRTMGAEDVGYFMDDIPGAFFFVGAADKTADAYYGHHHPRFSIDEEALPLGVALLSSAVASYIMPGT